MALAIAAGALAGTALNELLGVVKDARRKISSFEPILKRLESTLEAITPRIHEITLLSKKLHHHHHHQSGIADLIILARDGKDLVAKCSKLSSYNYVKKVQYSKMLQDLDCNLLRYFDTVLQLDQLKDTKEILLVLKELHCKLFPLDNDNDNKSQQIDEEIRSLSNLAAARWGGAEESENDELDDRAEDSSSSIVRGNQVYDDILKRVREVRKEDRAEDSASSLVRGNQVYDDILKRVLEVRKEDRTEDSSRPSKGIIKCMEDILKRVPEVRKKDRADQDSSSSLERDNQVDGILKRLLEFRNARPVQLTESEIRWLCIAARDIFLEQPNLLELEGPIKICGDIHGQYGDLLRHFENGGFPPQSNYLFLGNYVDHGKQSLETICLLLCFKIKYPENFFLLRGNHECASISRIYGFYDECRRRFNVRLWDKFIGCFDCLPVAALIDEKIFCMHGGLSPDLHNLDQITNIPRPTDVPKYGLLCDLLWSDPCRDVKGWGKNDDRGGVSYTFGPDRVSEFLQKHDLGLICRAHQVVEDGYEFFADRQLVTICSAPNYCGEYDNDGAMMSIDENLMCSFQILKPARS